MEYKYQIHLLLLIIYIMLVYVFVNGEYIPIEPNPIIHTLEFISVFMFIGIAFYLLRRINWVVDNITKWDILFLIFTVIMVYVVAFYFSVFIDFNVNMINLHNNCISNCSANYSCYCG